MQKRLFEKFSVPLTRVRREPIWEAIRATLVEYCLDTECGTFRWQEGKDNNFVLAFNTLTRIVGLPLVHRNLVTLTVDVKDDFCTVAIEARCGTREATQLAAAVLKETVLAAHTGLESVLLEAACS